MWWPIATSFLLFCLGALHFYWRARCTRERLRHESELARLRLECQQVSNHAGAQQQLLLDSMVEGLLLLDSDDRILLANRALENLFSVSSPIRGKKIIEALRNHQLEELAERIRNEGRILGFEFQSSELPPRWFRVNAAVIDGSENSPGTVFVFHDVTRLKQLENTRQEFVANVSHELRTPLSMIRGYVETLLDGAKDDPAVAAKFLRTIERHADRLSRLIEDLLTISQMESGEIRLHRESRELRPAVEKVIQDLEARAVIRKTRLHNEVSEGVFAYADFDRLDQVLWNLLDNAIKYGKEEGTVAIRAAASSDGGIEIRVEDDGPGIPESAKDRIFERFYRMDKGRSRDQGGTGLGLSIVKHVVLSHGGEVGVARSEQNGACFRFMLPKPEE